MQLDLKTNLTPLIFSPIGVKHQKEIRKEEKSLVVAVGVNSSTSLNMSGRGEANIEVELKKKAQLPLKGHEDVESRHVARSPEPVDLPLLPRSPHHHYHHHQAAQSAAPMHLHGAAHPQKRCLTD